MTYINAVKYILSLPDNDSHLADGAAFERIRLVCDILGSPQKKPINVHICGDVGKSSCFTMLEAILSHSHNSFGHYSFDSKNDIRECISVNKKPVSHAEFADAVKEISKIYKLRFQGITPHRGEIMILVAASCFANHACTVAIYEKKAIKNDPANALDIPALSFIAPLFDRHISAETLESLVHKGTLETVSCLQHKEVYNAISDTCALSGSRLTVPIYSDMEIKSITFLRTTFTYRGGEYSVRSFSPCQTINAITVIEAAGALRRVGINISDDSISKGLFSAYLDGKCETLSIEPGVILSSTCEPERLDSLFASLAQVKDRFLQSIDIYIDKDCGLDPAAFSSSLSSYGISHNQPICLSIDELEKAIRSSSSDISPKATAVFVGTKSYISNIKHILSDKLGF